MSVSGRSVAASDDADPSKLRKAMDELCAWEAQSGVFDFKIAEVPIWRALRNDFIERDLLKQHARDESNHNRPTFKRLVIFAGNVLRSLGQLRGVHRYDYIILGFPRRKKVREVWVDNFSDPIIDLLGQDRTLCIERPFTGVHYRPAKTKHILDYDFVIFLARSLSVMLGWSVGLVYSARVRRITTVLCERFGTGRRSTRTAIGVSVIRFWIEAACARWILSVARPKLVFLTSRWVHLPFAFACKQKRIAVVELQHGVPNPDSFKYRTRTDESLDPDWFLTFGEYWSRTDWGIPGDRVLPLGYPYIWERRNTVATHIRSSREGRVMLVSQPEMWSRLSRMFEGIVETHPALQFLLKLHPQDVDQWEERYPIALAANVEVEKDAAKDLYDLFAQWPVVVGYNSTVLFEAAFFGIKTGVLNFDGVNRCPAIEYSGRFNFLELREPSDLAKLLDAEKQEVATGNPFLGAFDSRVWNKVLSRATT